MDHSDVDVLRAEVIKLRDEVERLRTPDRAEQRTPDDRNGRVTTRRRLLSTAVIAGGAALVTSRPVSAADGEVVKQGELHECTETTEIRFPGTLGAARPRSHVFVAQDGAWVTPASPTASYLPEDGARASIAAYSGNHAMHGFFGQTNASIAGASGARFHGESAFAYGIMVAGRRATMRLRRPDGTQTAPPSRFDFHNDGEVTIDSDNNVWVCVESGNPGTWQKIAGPQAAGAFHAIEPARVFDSRLAAIPNSGKFAGNSNRVISVKDARDVKSGAISVNDVVPGGATAITCNVTITNTEAVGYVYVAPGDAATITASTVNWTAPNTTIANAGTVKLDGSRQVKVFCAANPTDVIVDVTGYYR